MRNIMRAVLLASSSFIVFTGLAHAAPGNAGFDDAVNTAWTFGADASILASHAQSPSNAVFSSCIGVGCLGSDANGVTGTATFYQDLNLAPGIYRLIYNVRVDGTTTDYGVGASLGARAILRSNFTATANAYQAFTDYSAVAGGITRLKFGLRHDNDNMHLDDVSLIMVDDGAGNNIGAVSLAVAAQNTYGFLDRLQNRFGHAGSPVQVALNQETNIASSDGSGYISANGKYRAHMSGYGDRSKWDGGDVKSQRWGLNVGAEMAVAESLDVGFSVAAGHSRFSSLTTFTNNRGEADEYLGALYAHWSPGSFPLYATAAVGYGYSSNDLTRTSVLGLGTVAARDVETTQLLASVELGYDWKLSNSFILTPYARADGSRIDQDGYAEIQYTGALLIPAIVAPVDQDAARTILGARGTFDLNVGRRGAKLTANAGWAHEFERDRTVAFTETTGVVTFAGTATGATPDASSVVAGANVEAPITNEARIFAGYNGNFASGQDSHAAELGVRIVW